MSPAKHKPKSPSKWLSWLGACLVLLGLLFFTPATDLLPVEILTTMHPEPGQTYFRIVPMNGEAFVIQPAFAKIGTGLALLGITLIAVATFIRLRRKS